MGPARVGSSLRLRMNVQFQRASSAPASNSMTSRRSTLRNFYRKCCNTCERPYRVHVEILSLKESAEERRCFIRDADDLVRCLTIEFEVELGLGSTVVPVGKKFELASPQAPLRKRGAPDSDAHTRRLPCDPAFLCDCFGRSDDAARDKTWPALVLAREDKDRIAFGDVLRSEEH